MRTLLCVSMAMSGKSIWTNVDGQGWGPWPFSHLELLIVKEPNALALTHSPSEKPVVFSAFLMYVCATITLYLQSASTVISVIHVISSPINYIRHAQVIMKRKDSSGFVLMLNIM